MPDVESVVRAPLAPCINPKISVRVPGEMHDGGPNCEGRSQVQKSLPQIPDIPPTATRAVDEFVLRQDADLGILERTAEGVHVAAHVDGHRIYAEVGLVAPIAGRVTAVHRGIE